MEENEAPNEDELTSYLVQFSTQESLESERSQQSSSPSNEPSFVKVSKENRQLVTAIREGQIFDLQNFVKCKYALDEADKRGWFPLHEASAQPIQQILEVILDASYKAMWEYKTCDGETPLTLAAKSGLVENVRTLLEKGVWPNTTNRKGETPLLIAIRQGSYKMASTLIEYNCTINQPCVKRWSAMHEAVKQGHNDIIALLLKNGGSVHLRDGYGVTPLGVAAEYGHCDVLEHLIHKGGDVCALADDGSSILFEAAGGGNPDCIAVLLEYGGSGNVPNKAGHLPIHRAAYEGHYLALKYLIPVTSTTAIRKSGQSPIHSAADGQNPQCLELLIENDFDVNASLANHISQSYDDERKTALYFAVSNNDILSTEILLQAGADPNKDPLNCLLVAVRAGNYEIVRLLLSYGANVNCYFNLVNDTHFPSAIQYALNDEVMLRLLLNHGYDVHMCFDCMHGDIFGNSFVWSTSEEEILPGWTSCIIKDNPFCDFITLPWMKHLVGSIVRILIDYMDYVPLCTKLKFVLETQTEWKEIQQILENPRPLKHLCRLKIRNCVGLERLYKPLSMKKLPLPSVLKGYIQYKEYDLYGRGLHDLP
ncbi:ankyrin repeat and SOCS box protein 15 isoform X2 [Sphaerodactylus townsendi]|nr:ankyrin repeat and SOCS box protein 15 isoform X2 [Sphaerodactylus townsendi]XP_048358147.1 ankyrin repeat and SOCS box protein 15 isoform X2 [Sphaerodactylus townsendi]XP_048358148.1 ankyrin repeat and SOCS box protein 15 isoform X2 [Sphaerodactylus townsendi]XP_048358149.1 ankyrin repeat and SOCS box protein 15 isoform X2 [Sphaerodactylus townsendi]XP_048358150.1 ankyrin repeat and SOCS box protein 15 isoform X2 [Sphaerodactylus townsendi]XP_048358151.1 ankyrin repeat and SOCS box protein